MSTYVIGDVHGCYSELKSLLDIIKFDRANDKLIFVGDLIGWGPNSLEVLDLIMDLGTASINVLGNHEIKFLAMTQGVYSNIIPNDLKNIFDSPKLDQYISWLSASPLMYIDTISDIVVTHAGLPPSWDVLTDTRKHVTLFDQYIALNGIKKTMQAIYSGDSLNWHNNMTLEEILRYTVFGLTKIKYCFNSGQFDTKFQCAPGVQPSYLAPWFKIRDPKLNNNYRLFFGHWAALGFYQEGSITCCDSGCVWGQQLTALKIHPTKHMFQVNSSVKASNHRQEYLKGVMQKE
jgi:bis(5'-nucleosyl)-tetraphosphatase (symmetrical)